MREQAKVAITLTSFRIAPVQSRRRALLPAASLDDDIPVQGDLALGQGDLRAAVFPPLHLQLVRGRAKLLNGHQGLHVQLQRHLVCCCRIHRRGDEIGVGDPLSGPRPTHPLPFCDLGSGDVAGGYQGGDRYSQFTVPVGKCFQVNNADPHLFSGEDLPQGDLENVRAILFQEKSAVSFVQGLIVDLESFFFLPDLPGDHPFAHPGAEPGDYRPVRQWKGIDDFERFFPRSCRAGPPSALHKDRRDLP